MIRNTLYGCFLLIGTVVCQEVRADHFLLANGSAWPGSVLRTSPSGADLFFVRDLRQPDSQVPKIQSLTTLADGRVVFCSGLDRSIMILSPSGEATLHHGGYLARQTRTDTNGELYWSGLETPLNNNPLPDGFIYHMNSRTNQVETLLTFSQGDVGRDWWGAFDIRDGRIFVGTNRAPAGIFEIVDSRPREVSRLPIGLTAFRWTDQGGLLACDGHGKLFHFPDPSNPQDHVMLIDSPTPFVDFCKVP